MKGQQGMLFDAEEMNSIEKGNLWNQQQGPVKCLGKHINNALREELSDMSTVAKFEIVQDVTGDCPLSY